MENNTNLVNNLKTSQKSNVGTETAVSLFYFKEIYNKSINEKINFFTDKISFFISFGF